MVDGLSHNAYDHHGGPAGAAPKGVIAPILRNVVDGITAHVNDCIKTAARSLATSIDTMSLSPSLPTIELSSGPLMVTKGSHYKSPPQLKAKTGKLEC